MHSACQAPGSRKPTSLARLRCGAHQSGARSALLPRRAEHQRLLLLYDAGTMDEFNQRTVPEAFIRAHTPSGRQRPDLPREALLERHELCEDLAQMLCETASTQRHELGITESDVLHRIAASLPEAGLELSPPEISWVTGRLAELLGWIDEQGQPLR